MKSEIRQGKHWRPFGVASREMVTGVASAASLVNNVRAYVLYVTISREFTCNNRHYFYMETELSFGQKAVGLSFNPSNDPTVQKIKELYAEIIDLCNDARTVADRSEKGRLFSVAITEAQGAQMWAVKAATWKD